MNNNERFRIAQVHICCFERSEKGGLKLELEKYPERLCVIDDVNDIVIDVETKHKYSYIRTVSMLYLLNDAQVKKIKIGQRAACVEYMNLPYKNLDSKTLMTCGEIINSLKQGVVFPDGNKELTNEQYLEMIMNQKRLIGLKTSKVENNEKEEGKTKKKCKKRK